MHKHLQTLSLSGTEFNESHPVTIGPWTITAHQTVDKDWAYYSKGWHRKHGPKVEIHSRNLQLVRPWGRYERAYRLDLNTWAGDFLGRAVAQLDLKPKSYHAPRRIRLHTAYDAQLIETKRGYKIYSRTLLGAHYDWVIESPLGMIYHDDDRAALVKGLHNKIRSQSRKLRGLIGWDECKQLGFCDTGIRQFCEIYGLDTHGSYTAAEVERAVRFNPAAAAPFLPELRTLAKAVNHHINMDATA